MTTLYHQSVALILAHQHAAGAYVASPTFSTYAYSWLRDGSFIAHAMDRVGQHASAAAFHRWVGLVLRRHDAKLADLTTRGLAGETIPLGEQMHCRFTVEGAESDAEWTNFQLDGYGTWLWALVDHLRRTGDAALYAELRPGVTRLVAYLRAFWQEPCYDCWEEFGDKLHTASLAAVYGGLQAIGSYDRTVADDTPAAISAFVLARCIVDGHLAKFLGSDMVDASLLGAATPYGLLASDDPIMVATVAQIERDLRAGGVRRYIEDTYYGGGEWLLLAAWLGWFYAEAGIPAHAHELLRWVADQATAAGELPEQICTDCLSPSHYQPWVERWGVVATPLLWSHAMYVILYHALGIPAPEETLV
jgi:GH15 family glucan-1,4-alpha-glucosidase